MDKLLGSFTKKYINTFTKNELLELEKLLDIDDDNLYNFYNDLNTNVDIEKNKVNLLFKKYQFQNE